MIKLRESNKKVIQKVLLESEEMKKDRALYTRLMGFDPLSEDGAKKFPVMEAGFSWNKVQSKLIEADSASSFGQFLRAGIQAITNAMYESVETSYEDWVTVVQSSKDTELYAPNHGVAFPRQVGPSMKYPEVGAAALDIKLKNFKFGSMYSIEKELLEDDQTGSFQRQASIMGEYMKILTEVLVYGKLASVANMQYIDYSIPVSETKPANEANYPWTSSAAPLVGGGFNKPTSAGALIQGNVQNGIIALSAQKNLQGIRMQVKPNRLLIGPTLSFDASVLMNSAYYPSGAATTGNVGGAFSINPIKGLLDITVSRFMGKNDGTFNGDSKAWYLVDDSKPWFILQLREAVTVEQEAVNAGASFEIDVHRFKTRSRMNADFIDPRFAWQGNDGSV
jgi:phage major head subunit gpT-like protein